MEDEVRRIVKDKLSESPGKYGVADVLDFEEVRRYMCPVGSLAPFDVRFIVWNLIDNNELGFVDGGLRLYVK